MFGYGLIQKYDWKEEKELLIIFINKINQYLQEQPHLIHYKKYFPLYECHQVKAFQRSRSTLKP